MFNQKNQSLTTFALILVCISLGACGRFRRNATSQASAASETTTSGGTAAPAGPTHITAAYHCLQEDACREYPTLSASTLENVQYGCTQFRGTWADGPCNVTNAVATCYMNDQNILWLPNARNLADAETQCTTAHHEWAPAAAGATAHAPTGFRCVMASDHTCQDHANFPSEAAASLYQQTCGNLQGTWEPGTCETAGVVATCASSDAQISLAKHYYRAREARSGQRSCSSRQGTWTAR